jgi:hypothetical protein
MPSDMLLHIYKSDKKGENRRKRLIADPQRISLILPKGNNEEYYRTKFSSLMELIVSDYSSEIKFVQKNKSMKLESANIFNSPEEALKSIINFIKKLLTVLKIEF